MLAKDRKRRFKLWYIFVLLLLFFATEKYLNILSIILFLIVDICNIFPVWYIFIFYPIILKNVSYFLASLWDNYPLFIPNNRFNLRIFSFQLNFHRYTQIEFTSNNNVKSSQDYNAIKYDFQYISKLLVKHSVKYRWESGWEY